MIRSVISPYAFHFKVPYWLLDDDFAGENLSNNLVEIYVLYRPMSSITLPAFASK